MGSRWGNLMYDLHDTGRLCGLIHKGLNPLLLCSCFLLHVKGTHLPQCGVVGGCTGEHIGGKCDAV